VSHTRITFQTHAFNARYSGSGGVADFFDEVDFTIEVWSGADGTHLQTLVGHTNSVVALAVGRNGNIHSGSWDNTIRVWDGANGAILGPTIQTFNRGFSTLIAGMSNEVYWADMYDTPSIYVISQSAIKGDPLCTLKGPVCTLRELTGTVMALALTRDGTLVSGGGYETVHRDESADDFDPNADVAFSSELKLW
jgi:WD40 repeat protein